MMRWAPFFALLIGLTVLALHTRSVQPWTLDDAYISMRYAEHFAQGKGIVFNEGEHSEGYTTFLWVLLLGIGNFLGAPMEPLAKGMGFFFCAATMLLLSISHWIAPRLNAQVAALATILCGTTGVFTVWSMSGMEVPLVAFCCTLATLLHLRAREAAPEGETPHQRWTIACSLACVLATMSRPEAGLVFLAFFIDRFILSIRRRDMDFFIFGLVFSAVYLPYFAWRFWYYGHLLPNTFYAKVGDNAAQITRGWNYVNKFLITGFSVAAPAAAGLLVSLALARRYGGGILTIAGLLSVHTVYVVMVGGDVMLASRFFATVLPLFALLGACVVGLGMSRPREILVATALIVALNVFQMANDPYIKATGGVGFNGAKVGRWLQEHAAPDTLIATNTAGSIPFFSKLPAIDTLGLTDETIAHRYLPNVGRGTPGHEKGDGKYVLSRKPDIIQFGSASGRAEPSFLGDKEVHASPEFRRDYVLRTYRLPDGMLVRLHIRKDREVAIGLPAPLDGKEAQKANAPRGKRPPRAAEPEVVR
jgi:hypothetical protein